MTTVKLNTIENEVYNACINAAKEEGDNGYEFTLCALKLELSKNQLKGYLGQLTQKGLLTPFEESYFDFGVIALTPKYEQYSEFNYQFDIVIN